MTDDIAPAQGKSPFRCPHCRVVATQGWQGVSAKGQGAGHNVTMSSCRNCQFGALWVEDELVYPLVPVAPDASPDMPDDVRELYDEAARVQPYSPRAAAALLRLALERLCCRLLQRPVHLNDAIGELSRDSSSRVQRAMDIVRVYGNDALHAGEIDLAEDRETGVVMFGLINLIVEDRMTAERQIEAIYARLPEAKRRQIEERNARQGAAGPAAD